MKKLYAFILLITHIFYNSCIAAERQMVPHNPKHLLQPRGLLPLFPKNPYGNNEEIPLKTLKTTATTVPPTTQPTKTQVNTNGDATFQPFTVSALDTLTTVYQPMKAVSTIKSKDQEEQKPFLRTLNPGVSKEKIVEDLYNKAVDICQEFNLDRFSALVTFMNNAKTENINEDTLAKHAYDLWLPYRNYTKEFKRTKEKPILFFGFLKGYNLKISTTKERMPQAEDLLQKESIKKIENKLAQELKLASSVNTTVDHYTYDAYSTSRNFPGFYAVKTYAKLDTWDDMNDFIFYIYSDKTSENKYATLSYDELKTLFYNTASQIADTYIPSEDNLLYNLLQIIEAGKILNPQKQEYNFGYDILKSPQTTVSKGLAAINCDPTVNTRKKMAMLCHIIKEYNDKREAKKTPTPKQHDAYLKYERKFGDYADKHTKSDFSFPNTFDSTLFDPAIYDFNGCSTLYNRMRLVRYASNENVQECIDQIYVSKS